MRNESGYGLPSDRDSSDKQSIKCPLEYLEDFLPLALSTLFGVRSPVWVQPRL
jgi:hypothetical protein